MSFLEDYVDQWIPEPNTGCYLWVGNALRDGRGYMCVEGKTVTVPRIVLAEKDGPPPSSKHEAAHDTPNGCIGAPCINPIHLRWATRAQNRQDIPSKIRQEIARRGRETLTPERRKEITLKAQAALSAQTPEQHSERARKGWATRRRDD